MSRVFEARAAMLGWRAVRVGLRLSIGVPMSRTRLQGMVDTTPLREFLMQALGTRDGSLPGIRRNLESGRTKAVALVTTVLPSIEAEGVAGWLGTFLYKPEPLYFVILLWLFFAGGGPVSLDALL